MNTSVWTHEQRKILSSRLAASLKRMYCAKEVYGKDMARLIAKPPLQCKNCKGAMSAVHDEVRTDFVDVDYFRHVFHCSYCGWWVFIKNELDVLDHRPSFDTSRFPFEDAYKSFPLIACEASLRNLDLRDLSLPIEVVRNYLVAKADARYSLHPRLLEEVVASVFNDFGYRSFVTSYSNDGGVDVLLYDATGDVIGVQVKRYRGRIELSQIRELLGALVLRGLTRGIFVTTSAFQGGASALADTARLSGYELQLVDGDKFLAALSTTRRPRITSVEEIADQVDSSTGIQVGMLVSPYRSMG